MSVKIERKHYKIDAEGKSVGRLATQIALVLRGKNKPEYTPNIDAGDIVEVGNIARLKFTGKKLEQKKYFRYSGYPGGLKTVKMRDVMQNKPAEILVRAVREMLPPNRLRNGMMKRLIIR
ncbi:MAG: 50S ribosomal protein L13 [Patescibacteria group bacterium]|jgi:large subunit ribosomal protein L13